jgi:hypothetical protein
MEQHMGNVARTQHMYAVGTPVHPWFQSRPLLGYHLLICGSFEVLNLFCRKWLFLMQLLERKAPEGGDTLLVSFGLIGGTSAKSINDSENSQFLFSKVRSKDIKYLFPLGSTLEDDSCGWPVGF